MPQAEHGHAGQPPAEFAPALLGAMAAHLGGVFLLAVATGGVATLAAIFHAGERAGDSGPTTGIALILAPLLDGIAMSDLALAAGIGATVAVILALKAAFHGFVKTVLTDREVSDGLAFAITTLVVRPQLPDRMAGRAKRDPAQMAPAVAGAALSTVATCRRIGCGDLRDCIYALGVDIEGCGRAWGRTSVQHHHRADPCRDDGRDAGSELSPSRKRSARAELPSGRPLQASSTRPPRDRWASPCALCPA